MTRAAKPPIADKLPGLRQRQRADGSWRVWWEPTPRQRDLGFAVVELDGDKPTWSRRKVADLNTQVARAMAGKPRQAVREGGRTMRALIRLYTGTAAQPSRQWAKLSPATQRSYRGHLNMIDAKWGDYAVSQFTAPMMQTWYETLHQHNGPTMANRALAMMSILMAHAVRHGWRPENSNPCTRLDKATTPPRDRVASWAEVDQLVASADTLGHPAIGTAVLMAVLQGQRQTDIRQARVDDFAPRAWTRPGGQAVTGLVWMFQRSKRGNMAVLPIHPELMPRLQADIEAARAAGRDVLLHDAALDRPFALDLFQKRFGTVRRHAMQTQPSLATLQFRDLRRTFAVWSRTGGASWEDAGDALGNRAGEDPLLGRTYMPPQFETASRAVMAVQRPEKSE